MLKLRCWEGGGGGGLVCWWFWWLFCCQGGLNAISLPGCRVVLVPPAWGLGCITEWLMLEGASGVQWPNPCSRQGHRAHDHVQVVLEGERSLHSFSGQG